MRVLLARFGAYVRRNLIALLALAVALSGTAYAANRIDGSDIVNRTITSKKLSQKAVIATARSANSVQGLHITGNSTKRGASLLREGEGGPSLVKLDDGEEVTLFESPPFTVRARCWHLDGGVNPDVQLLSERVTSTEDGWLASPAGPDKAISEPLPADEDLEIAQYEAKGPWSLTGTNAATTLAAPSGASLMIPPFTYGFNVFGADCVLSEYALGS
jgi:hypothetical protein